MDKYDVLFILDGISSVKDLFDPEKRKEAIEKYWKLKYEFMLMKYYQLRSKRSADYHKKRGDLPIAKGIERVFELDRRKKYAWEMFKPMKENKE